MLITTSVIRHMLFFDDDAINNLLIRFRLDASGYDGETTFFGNAANALKYLSLLEEKVSFSQPYIIFLDLAMPKMYGFGFLKAFKERALDSRLPSKIVVLTSSITNTSSNASRVVL